MPMTLRPLQAVANNPDDPMRELARQRLEAFDIEQKQLNQ